MGLCDWGIPASQPDHACIEGICLGTPHILKKKLINSSQKHTLYTISSPPVPSSNPEMSTSALGTGNFTTEVACLIHEENCCYQKGHRPWCMKTH
jgi:hypothetical protein